MQPPPEVPLSVSRCSTAREKSLTALNIGFDINTVVTISTVGNTTHGLAGIASRIIALCALDTLRTTSVWEVPTHPIVLAVGFVTDTLGRVSTGRSSIAFLAGKVAGRLDAAEGDRVGRVVTFLLAILALDLDGRTWLGSV